MPTDIEDLAEGFSPFAPSLPPADAGRAPKKERKKRGPKPAAQVEQPRQHGAAKRARPASAGKGTKHRQSRELRLPVSALFDAASGLKVEDGKLCYAMIEQLQGVSKQSRRRIVNALNRIFS